MAGGSKLLGEGVAERGKGVGARRVGQEGWGKGGQGGWNLYLNEVLNKTGIVTLSLVIGMHIMRRNQPKSWGIPDFWGESPCNDIIISQKCHVLAQEKSENEMCERFHLIIYARRSSHLGKLKNWLTLNF